MCGAALLLAAPSAPEQLAKLLADKRYLELGSSLARAANIPVPVRDFYAGVLANRENRLADSERLLAPLLKTRSAGLTPEQDKAGLRTLADDYMKLFRYADAEDTYSILLRRLGASLSGNEHDDISGSRQTVQLLRSAARQTVRLTRGFILPTT